MAGAPRLCVHRVGEPRRLPGRLWLPGRRTLQNQAGHEPARSIPGGRPRRSWARHGPGPGAVGV